MHILILPMYYPEKDSSPHRGYMFFEQAMQLVKSGCKTGLAFTEQRPLKNFTWKRFRKESHFQISAEDNGSFVTMRMHAWNPKLSTRTGGIIWSLLTVLLVRKYIRTQGGALRSRAGITGGTPQTGTLTTRPSSAEPYIASYYPTISDPSLLEIRRERGIELCLEGLRLNDLKRWNCCDLWVNDPWEGIFIPSLNQPLDVNGDGNYDAYFYDTDKIADEKYAAIGVYVGTNKSNVLNVKPVQGGYLMEYNYAGRSWPARQYLYPIPEVVIQFNTNLSQNPGW